MASRLFVGEKSYDSWTATKVAWLLISVFLSGCGEPSQANLRSARYVLEAPGPVMARQESVPNVATRDFIGFALNTLLLPLLDDDLPVRWSDPTVVFDCSGGRVTVDGKLPRIGAELPKKAFTLKWHMESCLPLDAYLDISGAVEVRVEPSDEGFEAVVHPQGLRVTSMYGTDVLSAPFTAKISAAH